MSSSIRKMAFITISMFIYFVGACGGSDNDKTDNNNDPVVSSETGDNNESIVSSESSSNNEHDDELNFELLSYKTPCFGLGQRLCLLQKNSNDESDEFFFFYDYIEGFEFTWGHRYQLSVNVEDIEFPLEDASSLRYELKELILDIEDDLGTTYEYERVELLESTFTKEFDTYYFLGQPFDCQVEVDCDGLININNSGGVVNVLFEYLGEGQIKLIQWS